MAEVRSMKMQKATTVLTTLVIDGSIRYYCTGKNQLK